MRRLVILSLLACAVAAALAGCASTHASANGSHATAATSATAPVAAASAPATRQIVSGQNSQCDETIASWTIFGTSTVELTTLISGPVIAQVNVTGSPSVNAYETISPLDTPYVINIKGVDPAKISSVVLYSQEEPGQEASQCTVPKASE